MSAAVNPNPNPRAWRHGLLIVDLERVALARFLEDSGYPNGGGLLEIYLDGTGSVVTAGTAMVAGPVRVEAVAFEIARSLIDAIEIYRSER